MSNAWSEKFQNLGKRVGELSHAVEAFLGEKVSELGPLDEKLKTLVGQLDELIKKQVQKASEHGLKKYPVKVKRFEHFKGELPSYQSLWASGFDVHAQLEEPIELAPGERVLIPTGMAFEIPAGFEIQVRPRSGLAIKQGVSLVNTPGTIDADYRGEVKVILINLGTEPVKIQQGDRMAQMVLCPIYQAEFQWVEELSSTERGSGGFGHTGLNK